MQIKSKEHEEIRALYNAICKEGKPGRLGKTFKTDENYYFLDTGTGKIAQLKENVHLVLKRLLESDSIDDLLNIDMDKKNLDLAISEIKEAIKNEHILSAPQLKTLTGNAVTNIEYILNNKVENVTLEVTEKCNLRCKYCIYNPSHPEFREFGHKNMSWDVAKKAIDFLKEHSKDSENIHIGFYGGEPLMNYSLIKKVVKYANELFSGNITFAMTTNAILVNEEIADFLMENDIDLIVSLDGPEDLHDSNRVLIDGKGSYEKTVKGLKLLFEAEKKFGKKSKVGFNMVIDGPDYEEKYTKVQKLMDEESWIPKDVNILTSSVDKGPKDSPYFIPQTKEEREYLYGVYEPLVTWEKNYKKEINNENKSLFSDAVMDKSMMLIHKRLLSDKPVKEYGMNGCCVPGERRIYVTVDGEFQICEKVGDIPNIGDVYNGFNIEQIKNIYVEGFIGEAKKYCKDCWGVNLCSLCYVNCFDKEGTHFSYRHNSCRSERAYLEASLIRYHQIVEKNPEQFIEYNNREFK